MQAGHEPALQARCVLSPVSRDSRAQIKVAEKARTCLYRRDSGMTEDEATAQAQLQEIAKGLRITCLALEGLHHRLPVPPEEALILQGEMPMNVALEIRSVIECVLADHLRTAISELQKAASYRPPGEEEA